MHPERREIARRGSVQPGRSVPSLPLRKVFGQVHPWHWSVFVLFATQLETPVSSGLAGGCSTFAAVASPCPSLRFQLPPPRPGHANIHNRKASVTMVNCWNEVEILFFIRALPAIIVNSESYRSIPVSLWNLRRHSKKDSHEVAGEKCLFTSKSWVNCRFISLICWESELAGGRGKTLHFEFIGYLPVSALLLLPPWCTWTNFVLWFKSQSSGSGISI